MSVCLCVCVGVGMCKCLKFGSRHQVPLNMELQEPPDLGSGNGTWGQLTVNCTTQPCVGENTTGRRNKRKGHGTSRSLADVRSTEDVCGLYSPNAPNDRKNDAWREYADRRWMEYLAQGETLAFPLAENEIPSAPLTQERNTEGRRLSS